MVWEVVILVVLAGAFVVLKIVQSESDRKRRLDRAQRDLRVKAATGGFAPKKWDEPETEENEPEDDACEEEIPEADEEPDSGEPEEKEKTD
ncbi:hypothetical protein OAK38_09500 [Verrucomicrobia bacterium]|nr:hypothetical protein [Verrucomicrobiota bacterium]